jgi:DNA polymerase-3 subunit epsilon
MREIVIDTETTGLHYSQGDRIIEIGCVEIIDKNITGETYHTYVNPKREVSVGAYEISGLTYEFLQKFQTFDAIYEEFLDFVKEDRLVIHNAPFDIGFLNFELGLVTAKLFKLEDVVDTLVMAKNKYPGSPSTLDALCKKFDVDSTMRTKHGALIDAELLAKVYLNMSVEIVQKDIFASIMLTNKDSKGSFDYATSLLERHFSPSEKELSLHDELLQKIKDPIWKKGFNRL